MEKPLRVRLHIISPVHIGCDDVYEPTGFAIDERRGKLIEFDPISFITSLTDQERQRFSSLCMQGNVASILSIYKFIANKQVNGREVDIAKEIIPHYKRVISLPVNDEKRIRQELNKFAISRTVYNPHNNQVYIPGSSINRALRTAYLNKLAKDENIKNCWNKYLQSRELENDSSKYYFIGKKNVAKRLEVNLLDGDFATDPFRMIKVSDFLPTVNVKTKIKYAINKKKRISNFRAKGEDIPQILEVVTEGSIFEGTINIQESRQEAGIRKPIEISGLLHAVHTFYKSTVDKESEVTNEINAGRFVVNKINETFKDKLDRVAFLLRIGRHSGAEAVTVEGNRHIKIMQAKGQQPKFLDHATTIWLASETSKPATNNGLIPFGWAVMEIME